MPYLRRHGDGADEQDQPLPAGRIHIGTNDDGNPPLQPRAQWRLTHPLTVRKTLTVHDLEDLALVLPPSHRPHRVAVERALHSADVNWTLAIEAEGWPLMLHFVTLGVGLAVVNGCVRTPTGLTSRPISGMPLIPYYAAYLPGRDQDPRVADLLAAISSRFT